MEWILANKDWIFGGIGVAIIGWIFFRKTGKGPIIKTGKKSNVNYIEGDLEIKGDFKLDNRDND